MKIDRLMSIILVLLDKERVSAKELAEMFEVSLRTIYRDIDAIDLAGIPICSTSGVGGGFEILKKYKLDQKVFSSADLSTILMGLSGLSNIVQDDGLINTFAKIKSMIPTDKAKEIEVKANQICIDLSQWIGNQKIQPYLEIIKTALQDHKILSFDYIAHHGSKTTRIVEPYQLVLKSSHWYLYGYCHERKDYRLFRLSRISNLQPQEELFIAKVYPKPQLTFPDGVVITRRTITIRIHQSIMDRVLDYCTYDTFQPDGDEHYLVAFPFIENHYHYDMLLSFGNQCECIEPVDVRMKVKQRIQEMASLYEK